MFDIIAKANTRHMAIYQERQLCADHMPQPQPK
jgi:hypothetical protein